MEKLTSQAVRDLMEKCLSDKGETQGITCVDGLVSNYNFKAVAIEANKDQIKELLDQLPDQFQAKKGGGWSFLNACNDYCGEQWTGFQRDMEALFCLGIAAGQAKWLMREMADIMPGGVPYVVVGITPEHPGPDIRTVSPRAEGQANG